MIYLIVRMIHSSKGDRIAEMSACFAFIVYVFSPETLWVQSTLYFCDVFAHMIFVAGVYLMLRRMMGTANGNWWPWFFCGYMFLFAYTDWIGVMFGVGVFILASSFRSNPNLKWVRTAVVCGTTAAVVVTILQYAHISGASGFLRFAFHKYLSRSGLGQDAAFRIHIWSWLGWLRVLLHYIRGYLPAFTLIAIWALIKRKEARVFPEIEISVALLCTALLPVVLHHIAFFNFTAIHDFSVLKGGAIIAITAGLGAAAIWQEPPDGTESRFRGAIAIITLALFCVWGVHQYESLIGAPDGGYVRVGQAIAEHSRDGEIVFVRYTEKFVSTHPDAWEEPYPAIALYAHRNIALWNGEKSAAELARLDGVSAAAIFTISDAGDSVTEVRHIAF
jgi:hypothetical protein